MKEKENNKIQNRHSATLIFALAVAVVVLFFLNIAFGSVEIPFSDVIGILLHQQSDASVAHPAWEYIILESRLPQAITAIFCGSSLAVSGLLLQTAFRNPLAGPGIFGISSGAGLGVAIVMLLMGGSISVEMFSFGGFAVIMAAAFAGAMLVTGIILLLSTMVRSNVMLLIAGIMVGYLASSAITLLNFSATEEGVRSYVMWGMGSFNGVSLAHLPLFVTLSSLGLLASVLLIKPLNALLLGDRYAENLGVDIRRTRRLLLVVTGLLTAVATAFCGPISFIGLAVPHISRMMIKNENHRQLLPVTILCGAVVALFCSFVCTLPGDRGILPLNALTPLVGAPVVIYVISRSDRS